MRKWLLSPFALASTRVSNLQLASIDLQWPEPLALSSYCSREGNHHPERCGLKGMGEGSSVRK